MLLEYIKEIIKAEMAGDKERLEELFINFYHNGYTYEDYLVYKKIYQEGRINRRDMLRNELDETTVKMYENFHFTKKLNDKYECYRYCASHIRIWLPEKVEELIEKSEYNEAYNLLCENYSELLVKRIQHGIETDEERASIHNMDWLWIKDGKEGLKRYFSFKKISNDPITEFVSTFREVGRMYRLQRKANE